jgi:predicted transcriptional regulator of viral defense system
MPKTPAQRILNLLKRMSVLRPRDLAAEGIPRTYLQRMVTSGILERPSRGLYVLAQSPVTEHQSLIEAAKRVPHGVVCLLSALQFHELTTQAPFEIWMAIGERARRPKVEYPPLRVLRFSVASLTTGSEAHVIDGVRVQVTSPAKTVADCFKYRNKIGLEVALEALRDCWRKKRATMDEIFRAAEVCRVTRVMQPYLESLV